MTSEAPGPSRVQRRIERWKRHLIDLTRRNKLLNFRPSRTSTVEVVDEVPQQVLAQLLEGETFFFDPKPEEEEEDEEGASAGEGQAGVEHGDEGGGAADNGGVWYGQETGPVARGPGDEGPRRRERRPVEGGREIRRTRGRDLEGHHTDDRLLTRHTEAGLEKRLLRVYRTAESALEEQGVNTLFLALGMLEWYDATDSDRVNRAPLVLVPVWLARENAASPFVLRLGDEEPLLNLALVEKLRIDFEITLLELPELTDDLDIDEIFFGIRAAVEGLRRWRLTSDIVLGLFDFRKFVMYRDLERYEPKLREHPVI